MPRRSASAGGSGCVVAGSQARAASVLRSADSRVAGSTSVASRSPLRSKATSSAAGGWPPAA
jgi:hypothetical protein